MFCGLFQYTSVICEIQMLSRLWCKSLLDVLGTGVFFLFLFFTQHACVREKKLNQRWRMCCGRFVPVV